MADDEELASPGTTIRDRWKVLKKLGEGGFGAVYEVFDLQNRETCAMKVEGAKERNQVLKMEVAVLRRLQGKPNICRFIGCGRNERFNYVVMMIVGRSLADLKREAKDQRFTIGTTIRLSHQCCRSLEDLHSIGYLHRDVKPEMGRGDDLWSLFYMTVEFLVGQLPWRKYTDKDEVGRMKESISPQVLLKGCPEEFFEIHKHLKSLKYPDKPDYNAIYRLLERVLQKTRVQINDPYDWETGKPSQGHGVPGGPPSVGRQQQIREQGEERDKTEGADDDPFGQDFNQAPAQPFVQQQPYPPQQRPHQGYGGSPGHGSYMPQQGYKGYQRRRG